MSYLERALVVVGRLPSCKTLTEQEIDVRLELRVALLARSNFERTAEVLDRAVTLATEIGDSRRLGWALSYSVHPSLELHHVDLALNAAQRAIDLAQITEDPILLLVSRHQLHVAYYSLGDFEQGIAFGLQNLNASDDLVADGLNRGIIGMLPHYLPSALAELGRFEEALSASDKMFRKVEASGNPWMIAIACITRGFAELRRGQHLRRFIGSTQLEPLSRLCIGNLDTLDSFGPRRCVFPYRKIQRGGGTRRDGCPAGRNR